MSRYYLENQLKPNPDKTQVSAFHLRNREANREMNVAWEGKRLDHTFTPKYLGVTLDRSLTFREHCKNTKQKVCARNNLLRRMTGSTWGATPHTLRTTALALCVSAAEYACPVWQSSTHSREADVAVNETCRFITGCLKPTPVAKLYQLAGIAPPAVRRNILTAVEKNKQECDPRHPLHTHKPVPRRLKSRKSFCTQPALEKSITTQEARIQKWKEQLGVQDSVVEIGEKLPAGAHLKWTTWKSLNRLRSGVGRSRENMRKWGILPEDANVDCGCGQPHTMQHLTQCPRCPVTCTFEDLRRATPRGVAVSEYWQHTI